MAASSRSDEVKTKRQAVKQNLGRVRVCAGARAEVDAFVVAPALVLVRSAFLPTEALTSGREATKQLQQLQVKVNVRARVRAREGECMVPVAAVLPASARPAALAVVAVAVVCAFVSPRGKG